MVVAEAPVEELEVCLHRGRTDMFTLATVYKNEKFDEIYCFCDDAARRDRWIAVFRRMGVAVFDPRERNSAAVPLQAALFQSILAEASSTA